MPFQLAFASSSAASDHALINHLVVLINDAYTKSEAGIWAPSAPFCRTSVADLQHCINASELVLAWSGTLDASTVLGAVRLQRRDVPLIAMLACDPAARGTGLGTALVRFCEDEARARGASAVHIDLLTPRAWDHPEKVRLAAWYERSGYVVIRRDQAETHYAELAPMLAGPCDVRVFEKRLN
ncbi:hypothetical protein GGTG_08915 [Gaeumannomyces tritici R3-111a-1]|uniref:N-acetyltransferase domain-containing protein n=1 Tax=Gaeumannomyces tritici (strain R3-111a-1) TaxID=644352 RepID=J3P5X5_GAET3|nr:hypothetical protein GGTG_08915 [Gaeumannomyces tritici R3-111a-1]EJT75077.1 hypothetical protein GGTG_08915 [Gaeumannomyces tritici R3-111a-1]